MARASACVVNCSRYVCAMSIDHEAELLLLSLSRAQREAFAVIHARRAADQLGELWTNDARNIVARPDHENVICLSHIAP